VDGTRWVIYRHARRWRIARSLAPGAGKARRWQRCHTHNHRDHFDIQLHISPSCSSHARLTPVIAAAPGRFPDRMSNHLIEGSRRRALHVLQLHRSAVHV